MDDGQSKHRVHGNQATPTSCETRPITAARDFMTSCRNRPALQCEQHMATIRGVQADQTSSLACADRGV